MVSEKRGGSEMDRLPGHMPGWMRELRYALWLPVYLLSFFLLERLITDSYWATQLPHMVQREGSCRMTQRRSSEQMSRAFTACICVP